MFDQNTPAALTQQLEENRESDAFQELLNRVGPQPAIAQQSEESALPGGLEDPSAEETGDYYG
tara:strand:- start:9 stop:197 length:189 start_codon:yes stop_codon:yes gene_type:complete